MTSIKCSNVDKMLGIKILRSSAKKNFTESNQGAFIDRRSGKLTNDGIYASSNFSKNLPTDE